MKIIWGFSSFGHGASLCVLINNIIIYYKQSSTYFLNQNIINEALSFGKPDLVCYYEKPFLKRLRHLFSGEYSKAFNLLTPKLHLMEFGVYTPIKYLYHHYSHASASYYTSDLDDSLILVADAIGEWDSLSIWYAKNNNLQKIISYKYPYSLGLLYTSFAKKLNVSEKLLMLSSKEGIVDSKQVLKIKKLLNTNLHKGLGFYNFDENTPRSLQYVFVNELKEKISKYTFLSKNLIFCGGCAHNYLAAKEIGAMVTISPGDESSSIGAVAGYVKQKILFNEEKFL
jgi:carbamoyltransferase